MITPERCFELSDIYRLAFNLDQKPDYLVARVKHMEEAINLANKTQGYPTDQGSPYSMACSLLGRFYLSGIQNRLTPNITTAKKFFKLSNELLARMGLVAFMEKNSQEFQEEIFKRANEKDIESCVYMVSFLHTKESNADYFDQYKLYLPAWIETIRQSDHKNVLLELIQQPKQIPKSTDEENPAIDAKIEQKSIAVKFFAPDEIGASISEVLGKLETAPDFFVQLAISVKKSVRFRYALIQHLPQLKNLWLKLLIYWQASPGLLTQDQVKKSTSLLISLNSLGISTQVVVLGDLSIHLASLLVLSPLEDKNMLAKVVYNLCLGQILRNPADFRIFFLLLEQAKEAWFELTPKYKCLLFYGLFVLHTQDNTSGAYRDSILSAVIQFAKILEGHNPASHYDQEDREMPIIAMQSAWAYEYFTRLKEKDFNAKQLQPIKAYYQYLKGMGFDYELKPNPSAMQQDMYKLLLAFCSDVKSEHRIAVKSAIIVDYFFENGKIIGQFDPLQHFLWTDDGKQIPAPRTVARDKICQLRGFKKIVIFTPEDLAQYKPGNWDALIRGFCLLQKKLAPYRNLTLEEFDPQAIAPKSKESKQGRGVKITPSSSLGYNQRQFFKPASDLAPLDSKQEIAICLSTLKEHFAPEVWADCNSFYRQAKIEDNQLALDYLLQQLQIKIKILPEVVGSAVSVRTPAGMVSFTG